MISLPRENPISLSARDLVDAGRDRKKGDPKMPVFLVMLMKTKSQKMGIGAVL
jgi:hypothetical protein